MTVRPFVGVFLVALATSACGKAGPPLPPLRIQPERPSDVALSQQGEVLQLSFVAPRESVDNLRLPVLDVAIAWTSEKDVNLSTAGERLELQAAPGELIRQILTPTPPVGAQVRATVAATAKGRTSQTAGPVTLVVAQPPPPPEGVTATLALDGPRISWTPMEFEAPVDEAPSSTEGAPSSSDALDRSKGRRRPVGIHVYERIGDGETWERVTTTPVVGDSYLHEGGAEEATCYAARVVLKTKPLVEGNLSREACVGPRSTLPLVPPSGLRAVAGDGEVALSWAPLADARATVVRVLRHEASGAPTVVAEVPAQVTTARDTSPPTGARITYTLVAADGQGRESSPSPEDTVLLRGERR